jgi:hypothetical protein
MRACAAGCGGPSSRSPSSTTPPATSAPTTVTRGQTFDQLYPTGHDKLGLSDQVRLAERASHPRGLEVSPFKATPVSVSYHSWWLDRPHRRPLRGERCAAGARAGWRRQLARRPGDRRAGHARAH